MSNTVSAVLTDKLASTFDIHKPEKRNELFRRYGKQGIGYYDLIKTLGYSSPVKQTTFSHFEEGWIHSNVEVRSNVADPGAGQPISFTLAASDLDSNNNFYIQVDDSAMFANQVTGSVIDIDVSTPSAPVVTVEPDQSTDNIGALTAGDIVIIYSNDFAEDTEQPDSIVSKPDEYSFSTQIIKQTRITSGSELTNQNWFDVDTDGNSIPTYYYKQALEADYEMKLRMDGASLFARPVTNTALLAAGKRNMTGVVPWMRTNGLSNNHGGTFALSDFDTMEEQLDSYNAPIENYGFLGLKFHQLIENTLRSDASFVNGGIIYAANQRSSEDLKIKFNSFSKTGRTYHFQRMGQLNQRQLYGSTGFDLKSLGFFAPTNKTKDARSNEKMPYMGFRYKKLGNYNREMETWYTGGAGNIRKTNTRDRMEVHYRTECGVEPAAADHWYLWEA